jgi:Flp pilus assembly protein TadG
MRANTLLRFLADRRGNIAMMFSLSMPVFVLAGGLAIDYSRAATTRTRLYAAADAASLAAVTPAMMNQSNSTAQAAALAAFDAAVARIGDLATTPTVTVTVVTDATSSGKRDVTINYSGVSNNMFGGLIGWPTTSISGHIDATASVPPNIDFYVLLDNSPSMALPQTQTGINQMIALTPSQDGGNGCALACHMASTGNSDTAGNPYWNPSNTTANCAKQSNGTYPAGCVQMDNYQLARANNIPLRIDNLTAGMTALLGDADGYRATLSAAGGVAPDTTIGFTNIMQKTVDTYTSGWSTAQSALNIMEMWSNGSMCGVSGSNPCGAGIGGNDVQTNWDNALSNANTQMTTPGNGTNVAGDKPKAVLFIVTDGVEDELSGSSRLIQAVNTNGAHNYCTDIKTRGIAIAILYTTYLPLTTNAFYNSNVAPFQANIATQLKACATTGLFHQAQVGEDLGQALGGLFSAYSKQAMLVSAF